MTRFYSSALLTLAVLCMAITAGDATFAQQPGQAIELFGDNFGVIANSYKVGRLRTTCPTVSAAFMRVRLIISNATEGFGSARRGSTSSSKSVTAVR